MTGYLRDDIFETPLGVQRQMASPRREDPNTTRNTSSLSLQKPPISQQQSAQTLDQNLDKDLEAALRPAGAALISSDAMKLITQRNKRTNDLANRSRQRVQTWLSTLAEPKTILTCK